MAVAPCKYPRIVIMALKNKLLSPNLSLKSQTYLTCLVPPRRYLRYRKKTTLMVIIIMFMIIIIVFIVKIMIMVVWG